VLDADTTFAVGLRIPDARLSSRLLSGAVGRGVTVAVGFPKKVATTPVSL